MQNNKFYENLNDGRCRKCIHASRVTSTPGGWEFLGCYCNPYKGKWVVEIKDCPIDKAETSK